jgi:lipoprotein-anchoring transpeptidase ErfK/SrfK
VAVVAAVTLLVGGCGVGPDTTGPGSDGPTSAGPVAGPDDEGRGARPSPTRPAALDALAGDDEPLDPDVGYVLTAQVPEVQVRDEPDGEVVHRLANPRTTGAPLTFLLADDGGDGWYEVLLPVRPNGSTGWVSEDDVTVAAVPYRLEMSVARNELTVLQGDEVLRTMPAASGTGDTPTPLGLFYLTELLVPTNTGYGPYAYGLSGFSEVLDSFGGGPGQIGLHGTDDPDSVGRSVSAGCIRLSDEDITYLAELLPLGTPVHIS